MYFLELKSFWLNLKLFQVQPSLLELLLSKAITCLETAFELTLHVEV